LPTDIHQDHLDDDKERQNANQRRERGEPLPRLCAGCKAVLPRAARELLELRPDPRADRS
jgi:hypothetical protein